MNKGFIYWTVIALLFLTMVIFPASRIMQRMGYSRWWSFSLVVPFANIILIWLLSLKPWPKDVASMEDDALEGEVIQAQPSQGTDWAGVGGCLLGIAFFGFAIAQMAVGFLGIEHELSKAWAWGALILAFLFRFTLPITVGSFFGAMNVLGWHWSLAALFAAPGLLLVVPGMIGVLIGMIRGK